MNLKILNCPEESFKPFVERSIQFYAKELITNTRIRNNCFTTVRFDSKINEYGFCSIEDYNSRKQPREFLIEVHPGLGARGILATLAHVLGLEDPSPINSLHLMLPLSVMHLVRHAGLSTQPNMSSYGVTNPVKSMPAFPLSQP